MESGKEQNIGVNIDLSAEELYNRAIHGTYDDAVLKGFAGTKDEFDTLLSKLKDYERHGKYTTGTTVASLDVDHEVHYILLSSNATLSVNAFGAQYNGREVTVYVQCSSQRTITIPTAGNYVSMCGSSYTCPAGRWVEFHLQCVKEAWHIAKLEQQ